MTKAELCYRLYEFACTLGGWGDEGMSLFYFKLWNDKYREDR